jgi:hypothetical protein
MKITHLAITGLLLGVMIASPVLAAERACLQSNRLRNWKVLDNQTLLITDTSYKNYRVSLSGACIALTDAVRQMVLRPATALGCMNSGDLVRFRSPGRGLVTCSVTNVQLAPSSGS